VWSAQGRAAYACLDSKLLQCLSRQKLACLAAWLLVLWNFMSGIREVGEGASVWGKRQWEDSGVEEGLQKLSQRSLRGQSEAEQKTCDVAATYLN